MWRLCDLHNHTTPNEQCDRDWDADHFVQSCIRAHLDVVAVTDHDHCDHVQDALLAAEGTRLEVIPGIELSTDQGHILALAPGEGGCEAIQDFSKRVGAVPEDQIKFDTLVGAFTTKRGTGQLLNDQIVLIGAHVDADASLLSTPTPMSVERQIDAAKQLHALEVLSSERLKEWMTSGVKQTDHQFALVRGYDTHDPITRRRVGTWIFLPEITAQYLRHAFALPESSISVSEDVPHIPDYFVDFIEFDDGLHVGERFEFSERANAIIGPPNAGKSLLVDAFKFVFDARCDIGEIEMTTDARMAATMPQGTVVRVGLQTPDGRRTIERTVGGSDVPQPPFRPIIFSQTELTRRSIATEPAIQLLDIHCSAVDEAKAAIAAHATQVSEAFVKLCSDAGKQNDLRSVVSNPEDGLAATKHDLQELAGRESIATVAMNLEKVAGWQAQAAKAVEDWLSDLDVADLSIPPAPDLNETDEDLSRLMPTDAAAVVADQAKEVVASAVSKAQKMLNEALEPSAVQLKLRRETSEDELERHGFERGSELLERVKRLQSRLGRLERQKTELDALEYSINDGLVGLKAALESVRDARSVLSETRKEGCRRVNKSMHSFFAKLDPTGTSSKLDTLFDDLKTGTMMHPTTRKRALEGLDRRRFMESAVRRLQGQPLASDPKFEEQDRVVSEAIEREKLVQIAELSCCFPGDTLDLSWKEQKPPTPFSGLTEGLRALAIKEISFAASTMPVISDQPEDAVPTRSVFKSLVPTLRQQRAARQFIVVSHDANIVVTSDVERIIVLGGNSDGKHAHGGLFDPLIQSAALEHLEGGRRAFMLRSDRYGTATS